MCIIRMYANYINLVSKKISEKLNINYEDVKDSIYIPKDKRNGHFSFPCFKVKKLNPHLLAEKLQEELLGIEGLEVYRNGPYLNFHVDLSDYYNVVLDKIKNMTTTTPNNNYEKTVILNDNSFKFMDLYEENIVLLQYLYYQILTKQGFEVIWISELKDNYTLKMSNIYRGLINKSIIDKENGVEIISLKEYNMCPYIIKDDYGRLNNNLAIYLTKVSKERVSNYITFNSDCSNFYIEKIILMKLENKKISNKLNEVKINLSDLYKLNKKHFKIKQFIEKYNKFIFYCSNHERKDEKLRFDYDEEKELIKNLIAWYEYIMLDIKRFDVFKYYDYVINIINIAEELLKIYERDGIITESRLKLLQVSYEIVLDLNVK